MKLSTPLLSTVLITLFLSVAPAEAATYYVDQTHPNANDSNPGTSDSAPWLTLQRAMQSDIVAGDTVWVKTGTYQNNTLTCDSAAITTRLGFEPANSGTPAAPISYRVSPGHTVIVARNVCPNPPANGPVPAIGSNGRDYITWDGFTIGPGNNVDVRNSTGNTLENLIIDRGPATNAPGNYDGIRLNVTQNTIVRNNVVRNVYYSDSSHHNAACYKSYHAYNTRVYNNEFYNCDAGIYDKANGISNIYEFNYIHDITISAVDFTGFQNCPQPPCRVENNIVRNNIVFNAKNGILIDLNDPSIMGNISVHNNTLHTVSRGIALTSPLPGMALYNNIITLSEPATNSAYTTYTFPRGLPVDLVSDFSNFRASSSPHAGFRVGTSVMAAIGTAPGQTVESLSAWQSRGFDLNSATIQPSFLGPLTGTPSPQAFTLQSGSPLKGAGRLGGVSSAVAVDIGAYTLGNEIVGLSGRPPPPDTTPPSAPTGLTAN